MPLYEYECQSCHRRLEKIQKFSDAPLTECPQCGGRLEKTISAPAVQFKGGGWYADLYSSSGKKNSASADAAKSESKAESKSESKSESKTESKTESKSSDSSGSSPAPSAPAATTPPNKK